MNEKSNMADSTRSHPFGNRPPAPHSFLLEAELDREGERRHGQGDAEHSSLSSAEEDVGARVNHQGAKRWAIPEDCISAGSTAAKPPQLASHKKAFLLNFSNDLLR